MSSRSAFETVTVYHDEHSEAQRRKAQRQRELTDRGYMLLDVVYTSQSTRYIYRRRCI